MIITAIKQQQKNPERVSLFVDGKYAFSLSLNELLEQKLKNGQELSPESLNKLKKLSADGKLRLRSMEWVLNRPRSQREFRDYMRRKNAEPEMVDKLIAEFESRAYLSEENYAKWLVELRSHGGKSNRAIAAELASKGIDRELAASALESCSSAETERIKQVIAKKIRLQRYQQDRQKLMQYLARQGFSYDLIKSQLSDNQD